MSARNVTGLVDGLAGTGFVTREAHPHDRRATLVTLTEHGEQAMRRMREEHAQFASLLFDDLPERQRTAFAAGLDHVVRRLRVLVEAGEDR